MILMIDNYDSFTYNLVQVLAGAGAEVEVVRNDAASVDALLARGPEGIVLSPGPGRPEDAGVCLELLRRRARVPLLGVCLGHQALGPRLRRHRRPRAAADARQDLARPPPGRGRLRRTCPTRSRPPATTAWRSRRGPCRPSSSRSPGRTTAR